MGELREVIADEVADFCNSSAWERGEIKSSEVADAILSALRAHFATPGAVTDEMCDALWTVIDDPNSVDELGTEDSTVTNRAIAAAFCEAFKP